MSFELTGRKALVTGASRGIGAAIAVAFARAGADVALLARDEERLRAVAEQVRDLGRNAVVVTVDLSDLDAVAPAVATAVAGLGGLDIVVNNAGGNSFSSATAQIRRSGWERTLRLNLDSVLAVCQAVAPTLLAQGHGSLINVSSVAGRAAVPGMAHYGAAKAAVNSLTRTLAVEWAPAGVRVNSLVPGWIDTDLTEFLRADGATEEQLLSTVPMHRWGRPEEIAEPAVFLASDAAAFMTGQELVVDGGLLVGR